ncbi:MAG: hypothetical protein IV097_11280 [Burkholderiaceae bacterium]|nr:hypothetical protein [uncultured Roseateles sp.]MBT9457190.1 hypothetical protein [Burkholderiaceae bacterium]
MNLAPHTHQVPAKRQPAEWTLEKGRKYEPFDSGKINGDQRSVARAIRMDRKR